jgi:ABC-2 type transport system permease protein
MITSKQGRIRRLKALIIKESLQIVKDPSAIMITAILPIFLLFLYAYGVSLDLNHLSIGLVLEDTAPDAQGFARSFINSPYFNAHISRDRRKAVEDLKKGAIRGFVVVPEYFSAFRKLPNKVAPIQVIADGSEPNTASFVQNYVQGALQVWLEEQVISNNLKGLPRVETVPRFWYNEQLESRNFLLPGSLAIIMTLIGTMLTALVVAREWERGTMESLISTPLQRGELILGKLLPYFFLGMMSMTICFTAAYILFDIPYRGSILVLGLVSAIFLFSALGLGFMISTLAKNQLVAYQVSIVTGFLPAYVLSGFLFEISSMPLWIRMMTYLMPARYFVQSLQTLFLVGNVWSLIFLNMLPLIAVGSIFFFIAAKKTVKRLD